MIFTYQKPRIMKPHGFLNRGFCFLLFRTVLQNLFYVFRLFSVGIHIVGVFDIIRICTAYFFALEAD